MSAVVAAPARLKSRAAPLVAVDEYEVLSPLEITAVKVIRADDPYLEGHYPDFAIYPGVFIIESVVQTVLLLAEETMDAPGGLVLAAIPSVRFVTPMLPGDTLHIRCQCTAAGGDGEAGEVRVRADCRNAEGAKAAQMKLVFRKAARHA